MTDNSEKYFHYWGKATSVTDGIDQRSYHLLAYHCLDVAAVGLELLTHDSHIFSKFIPSSGFDERMIRSNIPFFLALHDIGKFTDRFQNKRPELMQILQGKQVNVPDTPYHDDLGIFILESDIWRSVWDKNWLELDPEADGDWKYVWLPWFRAVSGHHGRPPRKGDHSVNAVDLFFTSDNRVAANSFATSCAGLFLQNSKLKARFEEILIPEFSRSSWLLAGLVVISDWLGSNSDYFPYYADPMPLEEYWHTHAKPQAARAVRESGILPAKVSLKNDMKSLFPAVKIQEQTPLQEYVSKCDLGQGPHLFILEDTTGSGKTEAAIVLAHRLMGQEEGEGIFMGLPTMATASAMYDRVGKAYQNMYDAGEKPSCVLAHSARHLSDHFLGTSRIFHGDQPDRSDSREPDSTVQASAWLSDNRKKALLAQVGIGTVDQALMAVLPFRHQSLRLFGLARNVLIIDEVHAYDSYMLSVLQRLLKFHAAFGGSAILLSATLAKLQRQELISSYCSGLGVNAETARSTEYPLVTIVKPSNIAECYVEPSPWSCRTINVECTDDLNAVYASLAASSAAGQCACWVRNTVDDAIESYTHMCSLIGSDQVILFHARFTMGDRIGKEGKEHVVLETFGKKSTPEIRRGKILIATQVVEQSLDLDFDFMISDLAPIDRIIQRAGRLQRHPERHNGRSEPRILILTPPDTPAPDIDWYARMFPHSAYVYRRHGQLWLTARLLRERNTISVPGDYRMLIEGVFGKGTRAQIPQGLLRHEIEEDGKERGHEALAFLNSLNLEKGYSATANQWDDDARTPTRLGGDTVTLVLLCWDGQTLRPWSNDTAHPFDMSQVSVRETMISAVGEYSGTLKQALETLKENLPGKGAWRVLLPLTLGQNNSWEGQAVDIKGRNIQIFYDRQFGLQVLRQ